MGTYPLRYDTSASPTITDTSAVPLIGDGKPPVGDPGFHEWAGDAVQFGTVADLRGQLNIGQGVYNVKTPAYGAKGDGATNDASAIQAAIAACHAAGGGIVYFPPSANRYYLGTTGLTIPGNNIVLMGAGRESTSLDYRGSGAAISNATPATNLTHCGFEKFTIYSQLAQAGHVAIQIENFARCWFRDLRLDCTTTANGTGLKLIGGASESTYHNEFYNVHIVNQTGVSIGDQCNANRWFGGLIEATAKAIAIEPTTLASGQNLFSGTEIQQGGATCIHLANLATGNFFTDVRCEPGVTSTVQIDNGATQNQFKGGSYASNVTFTDFAANLNQYFIAAGGINLNMDSAGSVVTYLASPWNYLRMSGTAVYVRDVIGRALQSQFSVLTYGATIAVDASFAGWFYINATDGNAFTISNPTNGPDTSHTQPITVEIKNSSGGVLGAVTWGNNYVFTQGAITYPANGKRRFFTFGVSNGVFIETSRATADY